MKYIFFFLLLLSSCQTSYVSKVISGNTIVLNNGEKVCYAGINIPNEWQSLCHDANAYLVLDKTVKLIEESNLSKEDEIVAWVYTPVKVGKEQKYLFVNAELIRFGFGKVEEISKECRHQELWNCMLDMEKEAKAYQRGIWSKHEK